MECLHAAETLSAHHDGFPVDAGTLAEATRHCETCAECAAFADALRRLDTLSRPEAPPELVARLVSMSTAEVLPAGPARHARVRRTWPRIVAAASAAAVVIAALAVGGTLASRLGTKQAETASIERSSEAPLADSTEESKDLAAGSASDTAATEAATAPLELVTFEGIVWSRTAGPPAGSEQLVPAGTVTSDLGTGAVRARAASFAAGDASVLYVEADDGGVVPFTRVVRTLGGLPYALVSDAPLDRFGDLPALPLRFGAPGVDGSPAFVPAGTDDVRVTIYAPPGASTREGFALAPNARSSISIGVPAVPVWSWWTPVAAVPPAR